MKSEFLRRVEILDEATEPWTNIDVLHVTCAAFTRKLKPQKQ